MSDLVVPEGFKYDEADEAFDTLLSREVVSPEPFDVGEPRFAAALAATLIDPRLLLFVIRRGSIQDNGVRAIIANKRKDLRAFWRAAQEKYRSL